MIAYYALEIGLSSGALSALTTMGERNRILVEWRKYLTGNSTVPLIVAIEGIVNEAEVRPTVLEIPLSEILYIGSTWAFDRRTPICSG